VSSDSHINSLVSDYIEMLMVISFVIYFMFGCALDLIFKRFHPKRKNRLDELFSPIGFLVTNTIRSSTFINYVPSGRFDILNPWCYVKYLCKLPDNVLE